MQTIGDEPGAPGRLGLLPDQRIGLAVIGAPLGMADNDGAGAGIGQHFGRKIAGMGARRLGVAILRADRERLRTARLLGKGRNQRRRRADQQIGLGGDFGRARQHGLEFGHGGLQAVHFPVAGDQRPDGVGHVRILSSNVRAPTCASRAPRDQFQIRAFRDRPSR